MADLLGYSITYRVAVGARAGQKVFSLQTVPAREEGPRKGVAQYAGFSLHAGIGVEADQREKLERLARYVSRLPVSLERARGNEAEAEQLLRAALARDPAAAVIHHALGLSLVRQGERVEAVAALGTAHELAPDDALFAYVYAVALHDTGQREAAIDMLTRAAERHSYDRRLRQALADYEAEAR